MYAVFVNGFDLEYARIDEQKVKPWGDLDY